MFKTDLHFFKIITDYITSPIVKDIIVFIILQFIYGFFIRKKILLKHDINEIINKIEEKVQVFRVLYMPSISKSSINLINKKNYNLYKSIETFLLNTNLSLSEVRIQSENLVRELQSTR